GRGPRPPLPAPLSRSGPDRDQGSHHGDFLLSDSSWQRAWLRNRWTSRCSHGLALGILSRYAAGFVAWPFVLLATRSARCCGSSGTEIIAPQRTRLFEPVPHTFLSHQLHRDDFDDFCNGRFGFLGTGVFALSRSKSRRRYDDLWPDHCSRGPGLDASGRRHRRQITSASSRFVFLGLWHRHVYCVSHFHCGPLHSVSSSVDRDVPCDLFLI